jgi:hypothetical protein
MAAVRFEKCHCRPVFKGGVDDVKVDWCAHGTAIASYIDGLRDHAHAIDTAKCHTNAPEHFHNAA